MTQSFKLEEDLLTYDRLNTLPEDLNSLILAWKQAVTATRSLRKKPFYILFEGLVEPVYSNIEYLQARETEMALWGDLCDEAKKYKFNTIINDHVNI